MCNYVQISMKMRSFPVLTIGIYSIQQGQWWNFVDSTRKTRFIIPSWKNTVYLPTLLY